MSRVLIEQHALINKFIGDGVFAFFNPPIHAVTEHARAGCEAAIQSFHMLEQLKRHLAEGPLGEDAWSLKMRIGLSTGEVFVGDYGSASKLDYTCIGDTVNLASRLESANKAFDSRILITETTRQEAGDGYVVRPLGRVQVVGKEQAVAVHELLGRSGEVSSERIAYAKLFADAVEKFQRRDWSGTLATLESCGEINSDDPAAAVLARNVQRCQTAQLPAEWNQAIELEVK
jgi:adenylate cyclase